MFALRLPELRLIVTATNSRADPWIPSGLQTWVSFAEPVSNGETGSEDRVQEVAPHEGVRTYQMVPAILYQGHGSCFHSLFQCLLLILIIIHVLIV